MNHKLKKFLVDYQEMIFWMPPAMALVFATYWLFPHIDPRSGIDGLGQLHAMLVNLVGGIMVCFSAWLTKRNYLGEFSREDKMQLQTFLVSHQVLPDEKRMLLFTRLGDTLEWIACFVFWSWVIF